MQSTLFPFPSANVVLVLACALAPAFAFADVPPDFETPPVLEASKILPSNLVSGPNHTVQPAVGSDGFVNIYNIDSRWGSVRAVSTGQLQEYVKELDAVAKLSQLRSSKEFTAGVTGVAGDAVKGAGALLTSPVQSMSGAVSGIGSMFGRAKEALTDPGAKGAQEDGRLANLLGYSKTKREFAYEFGVDVYSRNPILQKELDDVSRAAFAGSITAKMALMAVPGGAGLAVSVTRNTTQLNEVFRDLPPLELRKRNRSRLEAMNVNSDVIDLFIGNEVFTPRESTLIVEALSSMGGTDNRGAFIKYAVLTDDPDVALFRQRQAEIFADYSASGISLARFIMVGNVPVAQKADGTIVFCASLDTVYWTEHLGAFVEVFERALTQVPGVTGKELVLVGNLSPKAKQGLESVGWHIITRK